MCHAVSIIAFRHANDRNPYIAVVGRVCIILPDKASDQDFKVHGCHSRSPVTRGTRYICVFLCLNRINIPMGLYNLKKTLESVYYTHCIRQGKLPLPDLVYYHWDKKRIAKSLVSCTDRGKNDKQN